MNFGPFLVCWRLFGGPWQPVALFASYRQAVAEFHRVASNCAEGVEMLVLNHSGRTVIRTARLGRGGV